MSQDQNTNVGSTQPVVIDVRELAELRETGVLPGSHHLPLGQISPGTIARLQISPDTPILLVCRSGARSAVARDLLIRLGYAKVESLQGGVMPWIGTGRLVPYSLGSGK